MGKVKDGRFISSSVIDVVRCSEEMTDFYVSATRLDGD